MSRQSTFMKYDVFHILSQAAREFPLTFVTGAKGCGKTRILQHLSLWNCGRYFNIKEMGTDAALDLRDEIIKGIEYNDGHLYILDDVQYALHAEDFIKAISVAFHDKAVANETVNTHVVIAGGAPIAIKHWGYRAATANTMFVDLDFYAGINYDIEKYGDTLGYLKACVEEAEIAQKNSTNVFSETLGSNGETLGADILNRVVDEIWRFSTDRLNDTDLIRSCLRFLYSCELITFPCERREEITKILAGESEEKLRINWRDRFDICLAYPLQRLKNLDRYRESRKDKHND